MRTLLIVVTLFATPCYLGVKIQQAKRQREAVAAIEKLGGNVTYNWQLYALGYTLHRELPEPKWLRNLLGDDFFQVVIVVDLNRTKVTDTELEHVRCFAQLKRLMLGDTNVTDAGLKQLDGLKQLEWLTLSNTKVTDAGLERLQRLRKLKILDLSDNHITYAAVKKLKQALPNCEIFHSLPERLQKD